MIEEQLMWAAGVLLIFMILRRVIRKRPPSDYEKQLHRVLYHPEHRVRGKFE